MGCIEKIYSVSAVVGDGTCNANCNFCSAKKFRNDERNEVNFTKNLESAIKLSARYGGWSLSLTSFGDATCDPDSLTRALTVYSNCAKVGAYFPNVNLFTNGIKLADENFSNLYLPIWKELGLNNIAISVHSTNLEKQAAMYGLKKYPEFQSIIKNIRSNGMGVRATLLLHKGIVDDARSYEKAVNELFNLGIDNITSWIVGNPDGTKNDSTPDNIESILNFLSKNAILCHNHEWSGGIYDYKGNILRITDYVTRHNPAKDYVRQLVVFPDGNVCYSWIKEGALCMK